LRVPPSSNTSAPFLRYFSPATSTGNVRCALCSGLFSRPPSSEF
jgi:hypothetical protein